MNTYTSEKTALLDHLQSAESPEELDLRLEQLLTSTEYDEIIKRLQIFKMLEAGIPQRQIAHTLGVGIATVSRGARALKES